VFSYKIPRHIALLLIVYKAHPYAPKGMRIGLTS